MADLIKLDAVKFTKALEKSASDKALAFVAVNALNTKLGKGPSSLAAKINSEQASWQELSDAYRERKQKEGYSTKKWVRTGKLLEAVSKPLEKVGTRKGVKIGYKKSKSLGTLEIHKAIGKGRGEKKLSARGKRDAFYRNDYYRKLMEWTEADKRKVEKSVAAAFEELFKEEGLGL